MREAQTRPCPGGGDHKGPHAQSISVLTAAVLIHTFSALYKTVLIACESNEGHLDF